MQQEEPLQPQYHNNKYDGRTKRRKVVRALLKTRDLLKPKEELKRKTVSYGEKYIALPTNLYTSLISLNPYHNNPKVIIYILLNYYLITKPIYIKEFRQRIKSKLKEGPDFVFFIELRNLYYDLEQILKQTNYL